MCAVKIEPRLLFVPVSGEKGVGEYYRSLTIAGGAQRRWPHARIHFIVNRSAGYADEVPFPTVKVDGSPTYNSPAVSRAIAELNPQVVIFDSAGRVAQLRAARASGARTVYVSSRQSARRKGFRLRRLRHLDQHWLAWPVLLEGDLSIWERLKLRLAGSTEIIHLDSVYPPPDAKRAADFLGRLNLRAGEYVLFCAGGGGYQHAGAPAPEIFARAADQVCRDARIAAVWVRGPNYSGDGVAGPNVVVLPAVATHEMIDLLSGARIAVINGGSLLLQALALKVACVAAPVAGDQHARIARCARHGAVVPAALDARALSLATLALLREPVQLTELQTRVAALGLRNGVEQAVSALERLLGSAAA